ncbi:Hypp7931 [Branchiostoma lanceolatum]|uniref:Hypp7931 protein n=1 Tax=Branchiostoma lanceolatum TaxID=7740 RepID=A0A8J9Z5D9_BRALA|nr:Hypp7931 [Branchiostoma lanceolatum]
MAGATLMKRSSRPFLVKASLAVLLTLTLNVETTTAQTTASGTTLAPVRNVVRPEVVIVFELQAVWALIVMAVILWGEYKDQWDIVKHGSSFGPLPGVVISVVVIALLVAPPNNGTRAQEGFTTLMAQSCVSAGLSIGGAIAGFATKHNIGVGPRFSYATNSLLIAVGLMTGISGTINSVVHIGQASGLAGVILGAIASFLWVVAFAWYMSRFCMCNKGQSPQQGETNAAVAV